MNKDKNQNVLFNAGKRDAQNCADTDYVNTMNEMHIKASKKYEILEQPHLYNEVPLNGKEAVPIQLFANIKYQMIDWGNDIDNVEWFGKDENKTFGFFLDEKDRQCVINNYPEVAIRSAKIQPPLTKKTNIKEIDIHENNIIWIGMIKTENSNKSANEALNLAKKIKDAKSLQKVMFVVSCAPKNEQLVINVIKKVYPNFQPNIENKLRNECYNGKKKLFKRS